MKNIDLERQFDFVQSILLCQSIAARRAPADARGRTERHHRRRTDKKLIRAALPDWLTRWRIIAFGCGGAGKIFRAREQTRRGHQQWTRPHSGLDVFGASKRSCAPRPA